MLFTNKNIALPSPKVYMAESWPVWPTCDLVSYRSSVALEGAAPPHSLLSVLSLSEPAAGLG